MNLVVEPPGAAPRPLAGHSALDRLGAWVERGGPEPHEYAEVAGCFRLLRDAGVPPAAVAAVFAPTLTGECVHGFGYLKPHGYAGDFEIIDRIHTGWVSPDPALARWDRFFHAQPAPKAVRNRGRYFRELLAGPGPDGAGVRSVLNLGSGPGRDLHDHYRDHPGTGLRVLGVDLDPAAVRFASALCAPWSDRVRFGCRNLLRYRPDDRYDLVWSAGVFDYFSDRVFTAMVRKFVPAVNPGGELVVGNFGPDNSSRAYMELLGRWYLNHRSADALRTLAAAAGVPAAWVWVDREAEGVNLFLRVRVPR